MLNRFALIILVFCSAKVFAQTTQKYEVWLDYKHKEYLSPKLSLDGEAGVRADVSSGERNALYIKPQISIDASKIFSIGGGLAVFKNWESPVDNTEFRFEQQVIAKWPRINNFQFENRFRIEERYSHYQESDAIEVANEWTAQMRYRLMLISDAFQFSEGIKNMFVVLGSETFIPFENVNSDSFVLGERIILGFGQFLQNGKKYEVDFMWEGTLGAKDGEPRSNEWILRLRYYFQKNKFKK